MTKKIFEARVSFFTEIEANTQEEADEKVNALIDALGALETPLSWDDVTWDYTHVNAP